MNKFLSPILGILLVFLGFTLSWGAPKNTLVIAHAQDPVTLDPHNSIDYPSFNVFTNICETLIHRLPDLRLEPLLATSYKLINDTTWEFRLRQGVKFHNGEDFNAASVKLSLERIADPKNKLRQVMLQVIDRVEIIDDYTVRIITKTPNPFLDKTLSVMGAMLPPKYFQDKGPKYIATNPVGTGPYKFVRWVKDDHLELEANENYSRGAPRIKKVIFRPVPEATTRVSGLQAQEFDIIENLPPHLIRLIDWKGRSYVSKAPSSRTIFLAFDTTKGGPVADKRVRRAIAQAVNIENIIKKILAGDGIVQGLPYTKDYFGHDPGIEPYPYNPEQAKKLLAEAGYAQGFEFPIHYRFGFFNNEKEVAEAVAGDLRKVGIDATARIYEIGTFISKVTSHNAYPAYLSGWSSPTFEAGLTLRQVLHTKGAFSNYSNPKLDALIDQAWVTMDEKERTKIYFEAGKLIKEEVPLCLCYQHINIYGVNERVTWKGRTDERVMVFDISFKK